MTTGISLLLKKAQEYLPAEKLTAVQAAYDFASIAHQGQLRKSGEPYIEHPLQVALILAELQMDAHTLAAALLHDVAEDCAIPITEIESRFGAEVARLVDGVTKLSKLSLGAPSASVDRARQAENMRKMLVAMAEDLRVVFIKLADRLHNMRTLDAMPAEMHQRIAKETLEIYAPLAHRLGIWDLKWQLEDLAFRHVDPEKYHWIARMVAGRRTQRETFIEEVMKVLKSEFGKAGVKAEMSGRPKHIYSIYQKIEKYAALGKDFDDIHDLLALRVIVSTVSECYEALGIVHNLWHPLPDSFDDYIANPKPNGYQSLHTVVMYNGRTPLEAQIRTKEMHRISEYGLAAHWRYKEGDSPKTKRFEERISWMRQLIDWHRELSGAEEFLESVKTDIFIDQVFVYTPKGEIKDLPKGATPLDFAYRVHTELGHHCVGAKVNGRMVPLNYQLNNGDVVEIVTSRDSKGPSLDWLSPHLGYIQTTQGRTKLRQWFKKQARTENIERGRKLLEKEMRHLGIKLAEQENLAKQFKFDNLEEFLAAIGSGSLSTQGIAMKLAAAEEPPKEALPPTVAPPKAETASQIKVLGAGDMLTHLARCCHPVPGDAIIGYITRNRGVTVHRQDCYNVIHEEERERLVPVDWGRTSAVFPVNIQVDAWDRVGLIRDITAAVAEEKVNISAVSLVNHGGDITSLFCSLETNGLEQLSRLLSKIEGLRGIISAARISGDGGKQAMTTPAP